MKKNTLPRLRKLLVDNCEDALKEEAIALYNEIEEALRSARIDDIKKRFKVVKDDKSLPPLF